MSKMTAAGVLALAHSMGWQMPFPKQKEIVLSKCALPECKVETSRGYCCKEHLQQHRDLLKKRG